MQLNNLKSNPNFKEPEFGRHHLSKNMKTFAAVGYLAYLGLS